MFPLFSIARIPRELPENELDAVQNQSRSWYNLFPKDTG
jgi:hypothetical protein